MQRLFWVTLIFVLGCAACATTKKLPADSLLAEAQRASDKGLRLVEAGQYGQVELLYHRALEIRQLVLGKDHPQVATSLHNLAQLYQAQGQYARAEPLYERAVAIKEAALGNGHPAVANSLNGLAHLYHVQGRYARSEPLYERALAIQEATLGKNHSKVAITLNNLAGLYRAQGRYAQAEPLYERALAIQEAALGKNHSGLASTLNNLAHFYHEQGQYARAEPLYERALANGAVMGKNHPGLAPTLDNLAGLYQTQGQYARAEPLYERALEIRETALGKNHAEVATTLGNLAGFYLDQAQYARAEPLYMRALAIQEVALGEGHPEFATTLNNLALLYRLQGDYARAETLYERTLMTQEKALGKHHPKVAHILNSLAQLYSAQGQYAQAEPLFERALSIQEKALGKGHPDVVVSLHNLALLYCDQGLYARAEPLFARALEIEDATRGRSHPVVATLLNNLALLYKTQGQYARAKPLYERVLEIEEATLGRKHPSLAITLQNQAELHLSLRQPDAAVPLFERALSVSEQHLRREIFGLSEARLASVLSLLRESEEQLYEFVREYPDNDRVRRLAFSVTLLRKGRSAEEIAHTSRIVYQDLGPADRESFERLRALRTRLSALAFAGPGQDSVPDYQQRLGALIEQGDALEAELARRSERLRVLHALPPSSEILKRVAAVLPQGSALIEFVASSRPPRGESRYLALLLFPDGRTRALDLGPSAAIDQAAQRMHDMLAGRAVSYQPAAQALYALVFRPLVPHLGGVTRLFVAPEESLSLVPFAALHDGRQFLMDAWDITYLTSGKDLLRQPEAKPSAQSVVVLADPDFGSTSPTPSRTVLTEGSASLERFFSKQCPAFTHPLQLPGTRQEAKSIQRLLPQAQLLLGPDATKEALLKLASPGMLHIATHGFFLEDAPDPSDTRTVDPGLSVGGSAPCPADPLLRSGLVLAGAGAPQDGAGARGLETSLVTALELASLDLWSTQLVVLSACDTGRGDVRRGQGVYGLRRALVVAGAETVVTSLWKVNDGTTSQLMEAYYRHLVAGEGRVTALHESMRELRQKKPHPYYWAPFIAISQDKPLRWAPAVP